MALSSYRQLRLASDTIGKSPEKSLSGYRINRAGDDAAGLTTSEKMRVQIKGLESVTADTRDAISLVQTAEGAIQEARTMLNRMAGLVAKVANSAYSATGHQAITDEVKVLNMEIDRVSVNIEFNGKKLLDGTATALVLQVGPATADTVTVGIKEMTSADLSLNALDFTNTNGANMTLTAIKKAVDDISKVRSGVGTLQNRSGHIMSNPGTTKGSLTAAESRIRNVDMASEMVNYTKNSVLVQSAQAMLTQANL